jgi:uncharacterized protein (DUF1778 family)
MKPFRPSRSLMIRLDEEGKAVLARAAELRRIGISDYVRQVAVAQARKEVLAAREQVVSLSAQEQLAFWNALNASPVLTEAQRRLGSLMRLALSACQPEDEERRGRRTESWGR